MAISIKKLSTNNYAIWLIFILITFFLYGNTINHDYALDDAIVITDNSFTTNGIKGIKDIFTHESFTGFFGKQKELVSGGRYRPLSIASFAIEKELFGFNPHISHFLNIVFYALTGILIFFLLKILLINFRKDVQLLSFVIALLFIAHPIHTEVVTNIKGRDEIFTFLGALLAFIFSIRYIDTKKYFYLIFSFISLFFGLLAKENAITFLAIIPLGLYLFRKTNFKNILIIFIPLFFATLLFLIIRIKVVGLQFSEAPKELMNNPFVYATISQKFATIIYTFGIYIKLLIFPHPLTFDYYPKHISIVNWSNWHVILSLLFYSIIGIMSILEIKRYKLFSFSVLFYLLSFSIVSNIFFPIGTFMNERFVYISSLGFIIILSVLLIKLIKNKIALSLCVFVIFGLYSFKTIDRNKAWKNDFTLFTTDVKVSKNSAKSNTSAGGKLLEKAIEIKDTTIKREYVSKSIKYLEKALVIHPNYTDAQLLLGNAYWEGYHDFNKAMELYYKVAQKNPTNKHIFNNLNIINNIYKNIDDKILWFDRFYKINPNQFELTYNLGILYGRYKNNFKKSIPLLIKAVNLNPKSTEALKDLGVAYGMINNFEKSILIFEKVIAINPSDTQIYYNIGISYARLGKMDIAEKYFAKSKKQ